MKTFQSLLREERGEKAFKQAISMGLQYSGFGYWKDPQTGETKYKTENDTLIPVEQDISSEKYAGERPGDGLGADSLGGGMGMAGQQGMRGPGGMLMMPGQGGQVPGANIGDAPPPGTEQAPKDRTWEPGPDGDTCVGPDSKAPGEIPKDSYVGRTNFLKWTAGPDGDNMNTITPQYADDVVVKEETEGEAPNVARERMGKILAKKTATDFTNRAAQAAMNKMGDKHPSVFAKQVQSMLDIANRDKERTYDNTASVDRSRLERGKEADMWKKATKLPSIAKDADAVKAMNEAAKPLVQDPNYPLDYDPYGEEEGSGSFGTVHKDARGNMIKHGHLGPSELAALHRMRNNKAFPTLLNAKFDTPFRHLSSVENNPQGGETRKTGQEQYWDPEEQSSFDRRYPTAEGTYAMTPAKGVPLPDIFDDLDEAAQDKAMRSFWRARGDLHKAGFSHNDMHGGNIFVDPDTGEANIIDLGLAKEDKLSAFMEALGGADTEQGGDYQLAHQLSGAHLPERMSGMFGNNISDVEQMIYDNMESDPEKYDDYDEYHQYSPTHNRADTMVQDILRGDIRMDQERLDDIRETLPYLADDKNLDGLLKMLYNEVGNTELQDRMSDAFDRRQKDTKLIDIVNKMRNEKGKPDIEIKNKEVIPPKNMDFDD